MTDARDDQDIAESLDDDKLPGDYPPDEPMGVDDYGVTAAEELTDEPLEERVAREVPERGRPVDRGIGTLLDPDEGGSSDQEPDAVATLQQQDDDETLDDVAQERVDDVSAEEAAMHLTDPPPMGDGDGYLEDE